MPGAQSSVALLQAANLFARLERLAWACLIGLGACSFDPAPLVSGDGNRHPPPSSSGNGAGNDDHASSSAGSNASGAAGTQAPPDDTPVDDAGSIEPPPLVIDAGGDTPRDPPDAGGGRDSGGEPDPDPGPDPEPDAAIDEPDTGTPGCGAIPACVCAHDRLETPSDPCAAPDCELSACAPDDHCTLERFGGSVYYFCADARRQDQALDRCDDIDGMHLVYIGGADEDAFVLDHIDGKAWIGAVQDSGGVWRWLDGTPFYDEDTGDPVGGAYVNWDQSSNEPNNLGVGMGETTCGIAWSNTNAWADTNCPANNGYVCEREL